MIKTIIAEKSQHAAIANHFKQKQNIIVNLKIIPLYGFLNELLNVKENNYDQKLKEILIQIQPSLNILNNYVTNQTFIHDIKNFHINMYLHNINTKDLKNDSLKNKDLKLIFETIQDLIPNEINTLNQLKAFTKVNRLNEVYYSEQNYNEFELEIIKVLEAAGAQKLIPKTLETKQVQVYFENNIRSEIEASAQLIVNNKLTNALVIALNAEYLPLINQIYDRYHINYSSITSDKAQNYIINFISIVNLMVNQDHKSLIDFLSANPFNLKNIFSVSELVKLFNYDLQAFLNHQDIILDDPLLFKSNIDYYNEIKTKAKSDIELLQTILNSFNHLDNLQLIEKIFNYLLEHHYHPDLNILKNKLFNNKELLNNENLIDTLIKLLLKKETNIINPRQVVVTSKFKHYYFNNKNVIILGCTNKNFPNLKKLNGVIDEIYVEDLNYPLKTKRFKEQLLQYETIKQGENIYIFYPLSGYDGKAIEPSFSLLNFAELYNSYPKRYQLFENDKIEHKDYQLDSEIAKKLFLRNNKLYGSISSLERYNNCPYAYFLQYGLKIYPKELPSHSSAYLGSLTHSVIEQLVDKIINKEAFDIDKLINKAFIPLELLNDFKTKIVKIQLTKQIKQMYKHLLKQEADTYFKPIATEYKFNYNINDNITLVGYIDRIDAYNDYLRVIDYKSSKQALSESEFKQGLQLQLITYLLVASQAFNKQPAGAFYNTLRILDSNSNYGRVLKSKDFYYPTTKADIKAEYLKKNTLSGWHFTDTTNLYFSDKYVDGLYINAKEQLLIRGGHFNFETVTNILTTIYEDIYNNISAGIIDCLPIKNPCQFCNFQSICQTSTSNNFKAKIYNKQNLKKESDPNVHK